MLPQVQSNLGNVKLYRMCFNIKRNLLHSNKKGEDQLLTGTKIKICVHFEVIWTRYLIMCNETHWSKLMGLFLDIHWEYIPLGVMLYRDWCCPFLRQALTTKIESRITRNMATTTPTYRITSKRVFSMFSVKNTTNGN